MKYDLDSADRLRKVYDNLQGANKLIATYECDTDGNRVGKTDFSRRINNELSN